MNSDNLWPLGLYFLTVLLIVGGMLGLSHILGERHREAATDEPYESGIYPTGSGRLRFPAQFYLIAIMFVIFDLEAAFIFAWAVAVPEVGWLGFAEMAVFIGILLIALFYLWKVGALSWGRVEQHMPIKTNQKGID